MERKSKRDTHFVIFFNLEDHCLRRKTKKAIQYYRIKISLTIHFISFRLKIISECWKVENLNLRIA